MMRFLLIGAATAAFSLFAAAEAGAQCCKKAAGKSATVAKTADQGKARQSVEKQLPLLFNDACPVTGLPTSAKTPTVEHAGYRISLCCNNCRPLFAKLDQAKRTAFVAKLTGKNRRTAFPKLVVAKASGAKASCCAAAKPVEKKADCCAQAAKAKSNESTDCCQTKQVAKIATKESTECCKTAKTATKKSTECCKTAKTATKKSAECCKTAKAAPKKTECCESTQKKPEKAGCCESGKATAKAGDAKGATTAKK